MQANLIELDKLTEVNLDFIDSEYMQEDDSLVLVVEKGNGNKAYFIYRVYEDLVFHFSLLCEVGAPYQQTYKNLLAKYKLKLQTVETQDDYFETVVPAN